MVTHDFICGSADFHVSHAEIFGSTFILDMLMVMFEDKSALVESLNVKRHLLRSSIQLSETRGIK